MQTLNNKMPNGCLLGTQSYHLRKRMDLIATIVGFNLAYTQRSIRCSYFKDSLLLISEIPAGGQLDCLVTSHQEKH